MKRHRLKTKTEYFKSVGVRKKNFELRKNDRDFQEGDILELVEIDDDNGLTGRMKTAIVTYVLQGGVYGLDPEYCIMGMMNITSAFDELP